VGFALLTMFSIPLFTGRAGLREAWDSPAYWNRGIPILLLLIAAAGYVGKDVPWKLALSALAGHFIGVVLVKQPATDLGLLPLSLLLIGVPGLGALTLAAWLGQQLRQLLKPGV
jgi:hypothetical protein